MPYSVPFGNDLEEIPRQPLGKSAMLTLSKFGQSTISVNLIYRLEPTANRP